MTGRNRSGLSPTRPRTKFRKRGMDLPQFWPKQYQELEDLIRISPEIVITEDLIGIESAIRPIFYKKFNRVRSSFLAENYSDWLDAALFLCTKYMKSEDRLRELLRLEEVFMPVDLRRFLTDPLRQSIRELFDPLFEVLQGKIELDEFEEKALALVGASFPEFYQAGYIKWFVLSLIGNIEPEKVFEIPLVQPTSKQIIKHRDDIRQSIPFPSETKTLAFEVGRRDILLIPDFIVRSAWLEKYVAFRTGVGKAIWKAGYHSENREWLSIAAMVEEYGLTEFKPDLLLYIGEQLKDVALVADAEKVCRPDLMIFFTDQLDPHEDGLARKMEMVRLCHEILRPIKGSCVITRDHLPEVMTRGLDEQIKIIHFGFNNLKWEALLTLLNR